MTFFDPQQFTEAQTSHEDLIVDKVTQIYQADEKLVRIFRNRIYASDVASPISVMALPELIVTALNSDITEAPTGLWLETVPVYSIIRFESPKRGLRDVGAPGVSTLVRHMKLLLSASGNRLLNTTVGSESVEMAHAFNFSSISWDWEPITETRAAFQVILECRYDCHVDQDTGKLRNILAAGG